MDTNTKTMTSDERLDYTDYTDAKTTIHQKNCAETNDRVKRTLTVRQFMLGMVATSLATALLTSLFQWNAGYGVAKFFGLLNDDTPSGSEMYGFIEAQHEKNDFERDLSEQYHAIKDDIILGKDETIEKLHGDIESEKKQKHVLRVEKKQLEADNKKLVDQISADKMMEEALSVIALNIVPLNLQKYIGVAHDDQWIWFVNLACDRYAYNVVNTVKKIPKLMAIKTVSERIAVYDADYNLMTQNTVLKTENTKLKAEIKNSTAAYNQQAGRLGDLKKAYAALVTNFKKSTAN
jgi:regulator of replication initiation timing